ncbi:MAG: hypothetical protein J0H76_05065 [Sphingobacteriales bacterium]|nr:hypothetical protein [Sphingobacteriales bacterium]
MENNNIIHTPQGTVIMNGGNALPGCPNDWDEAYKLEKQLNNDEEFDREDLPFNPTWKFDCCFKLDYDGSLVRISSRFYPPKTHYGATWDGNVTVYFLGEKVSKRAFDCPTLDELKSQVEAYVKSITDNLKVALK